MKTLNSPARITASWDEDTRVWMATSEDIPGLCAQADTFEELVGLLPELAADLLSADGWPGAGHDPVPLEILARHHSVAYPHQQ
jgi:predicted RNase H-like HicB family nuclease